MKWVSERRFLHFIEDIKKLFAYKSELPTKVSQLENDSEYASKDYVEQEIATFDFIKIVVELPEVGILNRTYLVAKADASNNDFYDEYIWTGDKWEFIGTKKIELDLTEYLKIPKPASNSILGIQGGETGVVELIGYTNHYPFANKFLKLAAETEGDSILGDGYVISNTPTRKYHCATKKYVDNLFKTIVNGNEVAY